MNEQKLKELFTAEINNSAPDKDALWSRIEGRLQPKCEVITEAPRKKALNTNIIKILAAAACLALVLIVPLTLRNNAVLSEDIPMNESSVDSEANDMMSEPDNSADSVLQEGTAEPKGYLSYNELQFDSYSVTYLSCTGEPYGESYFVEEDILSDTDLIVRAEVEKVYKSDDGESLCYELDVIQGYPESSKTTIIAESRSPYKMRRGREYLIPLAETEDGWRTVYDSVPQTEFTSDGGAVYYNGWSSLDTDGSEWLIYPQSSEEDHFYDRMMYSEDGDISALIRKWETIVRS